MKADLRVVQIGLARFAKDQRPADLLCRWPMLTEIPAAVGSGGVRIDVLHTAWTDEVIEHNGVTCRFIRERWPPFIRLYGRRVPLPPRRLARIARSLDPHVVHINGLVFPIQTRYLASALRPVPVLVEQRARPRWKGWRRRLHRWGLEKVAAVAFTTREQARYYYDTGVLRRSLPLFEVLGGSTSFTPGDRTVARARSGLYGDPCLLWVGRLNSNKDPLTVVEALRIIALELPNPHLWMCYEDAPLLRSVLERIDHDPVLRSRVHLRGAHPRRVLEQWYRAADLFVLGSHYESTGFAPIESLACGTPALLTDIPSFRLITDNGRVGALFPPRDAAALARAIVEWSRRDPVQSRHDARNHFERTLSFHVLGRQLRAAYAAVAALGKSREGSVGPAS